MSAPRVFDWTAHAKVKADREAWVTADVERTIFEHHHRRQRQHDPDKADWRLTVGRLGVVYNWPVDRDPLRARIVSVWRLPRPR